MVELMASGWEVRGFPEPKHLGGCVRRPLWESWGTPGVEIKTK